MKIKIKVNDLKKNKNICLRVNDQIEGMLKNKGYKMQEIFDSAIDKILKIEIK